MSPTGFALAEFKIMLAALVGAFEITKASDEKDLRIEWGIIARIRDGLKVNLKPVSDSSIYSSEMTGAWN
jgi:cytochrome P450